MFSIFQHDDRMTHKFAVEFKEHKGLDILQDLKAEDSIPQRLHELIVDILKSQSRMEKGHDIDDNAKQE